MSEPKAVHLVDGSRRDVVPGTWTTWRVVVEGRARDLVAFEYTDQGGRGGRVRECPVENIVESEYGDGE